MATHSMANADNAIKIEDSPEPTLLDLPSVEDVTLDGAPAADEANSAPLASTIDPKDPEGFLRRCSGYNKKTKVRCSQVIGKAYSKGGHFTYLPTCKAHREQYAFAGWCQFAQKDGERCGRLFRWTPPYFELCAEHQGHPDTPCYFMKLPLEIRLEVFSYLLPTQPIGSSTHIGHRDPGPPPVSPRVNLLLASHPPPLYTFTPPPPLQPVQPTAASAPPIRQRRCAIRQPPMSFAESAREFPFLLLNLFLISRQVYAEAKDFLFSTVPFVIDIRKDGTFMCGRRLLEPRRGDGSAHFFVEDEEATKQRFIENFDFKSVKNYNVDILVENWDTGNTHNRSNYNSHSWDEEVEIYDIRDYVSVAVSGILALSRSLCKLNVHLGFSQFTWSEEQLLANTKSLVGPFERLRNVRQPRFCGVYEGTTHGKFMINVPGPNAMASPPKRPIPLCSVPQLPTHTLLMGPGYPGFDEYKSNWERLISRTASSSLCKNPPIRAMFTEFKEFYTSLSPIVPSVMSRNGKMAFLHRARVARENEDIEGFRHLRNELIEYWYAYLEQEEQKKDNMNKKLSHMLDTDIYPSHEADIMSRRGSSASDPQSPIMLDTQKMAAEGIPMQGNQTTEQQRRQFQARQQQQRMQRHMLARQAHQLRQAIQAGTSSSASNTTNHAHVIVPPQISAPMQIQMQQSQVQLQLMQQQRQALDVQAQLRMQQQLLARQAASQQARVLQQQMWPSSPQAFSTDQGMPRKRILPPHGDDRAIIGSPEVTTASGPSNHISDISSTSDTVLPSASVDQASKPAQSQPFAYSPSTHSTTLTSTMLGTSEHESNGCANIAFPASLSNYYPPAEYCDPTISETTNALLSSSSGIRDHYASLSSTSAIIRENASSEDTSWDRNSVPAFPSQLPYNANESSRSYAHDIQGPLAKKRRVDFGKKEHEHLHVNTNMDSNNFDGIIALDSGIDESMQQPFCLSAGLQPMNNDVSSDTGWDGVGKGKGKASVMEPEVVWLD